MKRVIFCVTFLCVAFNGGVAAEESELSYRNVTVSYIDG